MSQPEMIIIVKCQKCRMNLVADNRNKEFDSTWSILLSDRFQMKVVRGKDGGDVWLCEKCTEEYEAIVTENAERRILFVEGGKE